MKKINYNGIAKIKPLLFTAILIILFMILIPILSIGTENNKDPNEHIEEEEISEETSAQVSSDVYIDGD